VSEHERASQWRIYLQVFGVLGMLLRGPFRRQRKGEPSESAFMASGRPALRWREFNKSGGALSVVACEKFWSVVYRHGDW
jgi:hypothetical protein